MEFNFFNAKELNIDRLKCTIHKSGKLGFNDSARQRLNIVEGMRILIGNSRNENDANLYMKVTSEDDETGFRVNKNGDYYNINTKNLFDNLHVDYVNPEKTIMFYLQEMDVNGEKIYRMKMKERTKNREDATSGSEEN